MTKSEQARADAMADAASYESILVPPFFHKAANYLRHMDAWGFHDYTRFVAWQARQDARDAFRAVPGLRG